MKLKIKDKIICSNVMIANTFLKRLKGLMFDKSMKRDECMLIKPCNMIHTYFMNYNIDVLFVDKEDKIVGMCEDMKRGKASKYYNKALYVLEFRDGVIKEYNIKIGDKVLMYM